MNFVTLITLDFLKLVNYKHKAQQFFFIINHPITDYI